MTWDGFRRFARLSSGLGLMVSVTNCSYLAAPSAPVTSAPATSKTLHIPTTTPLPLQPLTTLPAVTPLHTPPSYPSEAPAHTSIILSSPISQLAKISSSNAAHLSPVGHADLPGVQDIALSADTQFLAANLDGQVSVWNISGAYIGGTIESHQPIARLQFSPSDALLAVPSPASIELWHLRTNHLLNRFEFPVSGVGSLAFSTDGQLLGVGGLADGAVGVMSVYSGKPVSVGLQGPAGQITSVAFGPNSLSFAAASTYGKIRHWNIQNGQLLHEFTSPLEDDITCMAFTSDGSQLTTIAGGFRSPGISINRWDIATGSMLQHMERADSKPSLSPDGSLMATITDSGTLAIAEIVSGRTLSSWSITGETLRLAFSPDGRFLASVQANGSVVLYGVLSPQ